MTERGRGGKKGRDSVKGMAVGGEARQGRRGRVVTVGGCEGSQKERREMGVTEHRREGKGLQC